MGRVRPPRPRRRIPRSRLPLHRRLLADPAGLRRWLLVLALATTTAILTGSVLARADRARHRWGETAPVLVADRTLEPGDRLTDAVSTKRWPLALVPPDAASTVAPEATASRTIGPGIAITTDALDPPGPEASDRRRIALPVGAAPLPVTAGDRVEVWTTVDPSLAGGELSTRRVATEAVVASAGERSVVVAVAVDDVAAVTEAAALATVTLVGVG